MDKSKSRIKRKRRIRKNIFGTAAKPRLSVFKSAKHISVQIVDDTSGITLVSASTYKKGGTENSSNIKGAVMVGEAIATIAKSKKIDNVVFDRNGFRYHGRIRALAEAAREKGLKF